MSKMIRYVALAAMLTATWCLAQLAGLPASRDYVDNKVAVEAQQRQIGDSKRTTPAQAQALADARIDVKVPSMVWLKEQSQSSNALTRLWLLQLQQRTNYWNEAWGLAETALQPAATNDMLRTAADIAGVGGLLAVTASNQFLRVVEVAPGRWQHRLPGED